ELAVDWRWRAYIHYLLPVEPANRAAFRPRRGDLSNWSSFTPTVECNKRNCVTSSCPVAGACVISRSGGNRSARSRFSERNVDNSLRIYADLELNNSTRAFTCSRRAVQLMVTNG